MCKALWLQIVNIEVIRQLQIVMMGITVDDIQCSCKDGLSPASVKDIHTHLCPRRGIDLHGSRLSLPLFRVGVKHHR